MAFLAEYGAELLRRGYPIVPIKHGTKYPGFDGWQHTVATEALIAGWLANGHAKGGVGVLAARVPAADLDILDVEVCSLMVQKVQDVCGATLQRIGKAPKVLLPFRADAPFAKVSSRSYRDFLGRVHKVEILGKGQQWVAYADHPDTKAPYRWVDDKGIASVDLADLPTITAAQAQEIVDYFETIVPDDWEEVKGSGLTGDRAAPSTNPLDNLSPPLDLSDRQVEICLEKLDADMIMADWVRVGMGLYHQYAGGGYGFALWDSWSRGGQKYNQAEMQARWRSFDADLHSTKPTTFATVLAMAQDAKAAEIKARESAPDRKFRLLPTADILRRLGPISWRVKGFLETDTTGVIFGDPGSFKSFLALDMAFHIAAGKDWHGAEVEQGPVIYIAGEGHNGLARRYAAWGVANGVNLADVPLYTSNRATDLYNADTANMVAETVSEMAETVGAPAVIVIDTLAKNFTGDENSAADIGQFISNIDQLLRQPFGATVIVVHHTGHGAKDRGRGSAAMKGGVDFEYLVEKPDDKIRARLKNTRMKDGPDGHETWFEGREVAVAEFDGEVVESLVFDKCEAPVRGEAPLPKKQAALFELITQEAPVARKTLCGIALDTHVCVSAGAFRSALDELKQKDLVAENETYISVVELFPEDEK